MITPFTKELEFEKRLAEMLTQHGWEEHILYNPTEADLLKNWASIIWNNNRDINRLGDFPLTDGEMAQIVQAFDNCKNPYERNQLLIGEYVQITRDNRQDANNYRKPVYLKLFDSREINAGQSTYQIVRQPKFGTSHPLASDRRGDVMLLINGMPLIHIELKRSGVDVSQAANQIKKYTHEGVFGRGIFSLVQIFVAMTPEKTLYFANPGAKDKFSASYYFHWADFNNKEAEDWKYIAANLLSVPMAHQMVGQYTIADDKDETLKVLRSYQYYAANAICDKVRKTYWDDHMHRGGFIWHTTGSGKTMTSFKAAQLVAKAGDADKVVFLLDRIELSTQSADEYRGFANADDNVLDTENTANLISLLESNDRDTNLIVTSLQKMSRVNARYGVPQSILDAINKKRVVFIVDECHRGVFGSMLMEIKNTFPRALLFGFTGTPVFDDNSHGELTTEVIFGDNLHKYTLADGIPDGNVLGFDLYKEETIKEEDLRDRYARVRYKEEIGEEYDEENGIEKLYKNFYNEEDILKVEDKLKKAYSSEGHHKEVMYKIIEDFPTIGHNGKFHAMLATKSIPEAIEYYKLFKEHYPDYNVAAIFDDNIDNNGNAEYKEDAILEMLDDYNRRFGTSFQQSTYSKYKKDVAKRLAHKAPYQKLEKKKQINLLIVVTQMLTGYDSKWVNALYVDKLLKYVDVIQAFSRTNRLFGPEKPFGIIKYFTRPNRMKKNIAEAMDLYVDQPMLVFMDKLEANIEKINKAYAMIKAIFEAEGIMDFSRLPESQISRRKFAKEFCEMSRVLEAAKMQGFRWDKKEYEFKHTNSYVKVSVELDEETYQTLLQRYKELFEKKTSGPKDEDEYEIDTYLTETGAGTIDADYINSKFQRYVRYLYTEGKDSELVSTTQQELHRVFATLSQRDQRTAYSIIHDIQSGRLRLSPGKTIHDYIKDYQKKEADWQILRISEITGLDLQKLKDITMGDVTEQNINERGRFDELRQTAERAKVKEFIKRITGQEVKPMFIQAKLAKILERFILEPEDRAKILYAYDNEDAVLDQNVTDEDIERSEEEKRDEESETRPADDSRLSDEEKRNNVALMVMKNLRGLNDMPGTDESVEAFFKINLIRTVQSLNGLTFELHHAFDGLFARREVDYISKQNHLNTLTTRFEVYLKKLYYLINGRELAAEEGSDRLPSLKEAIRSIRCLREIDCKYGEKYRRLEKYLADLRHRRNEAAHNAIYYSDEELDRRIKETVTLYIYVTGASLGEIRLNHSGV